MSELTPNLGLFKYDPLTDGKEVFSINTALNNNWDILDKNIGSRAVKGYLENGNLLTDKEGLSYVKKYTHSTFDPTKFTVMGSPTITSNGVVSNFSNSNFLKSTIPALTNNNSFTISGSFFNGQFSGFDRTVFNFSGWNANMGQARTNGVYLTWAGVSIPTLSISNANDVWLDFIFEYVANTKITLKIKKSTDEAYTLTSEASMSGVTFSYADFAVGAWWNGNYAFRYGSIDLKQFSITVDGVEVFSGNKTAVDTIKHDDYTVVGTPTITDDGIVSGFSGSDYVTGYTISQGTYNFDIFGSFETVNTLITNTTPISFSGGISGFLLQTTNTGIRIYNTTDNTSWGTEWATANLSNNTKYYFRVLQDSTTCYFYLGTNINNLSLINSTNNLAKFISGNVYIGTRYGNLNQFWTGSIDLNAFKIYVDGNLVYQPCLKIPYTESKTGSKIVQSVYRDRVSDMYEQFGLAPYYTLSDIDFTLPMGEIYGMKMDRMDLTEVQCVIDSYSNGTSWYRIWSDGWCEQGGILNVSGTSQVISFLKPYINTNYIITYANGYNSVPSGTHLTCFGNKTTNSITRFGSSSWALTYWRTEGYIR